MMALASTGVNVEMMVAAAMGYRSEHHPLGLGVDSCGNGSSKRSHGSFRASGENGTHRRGLN